VSVTPGVTYLDSFGFLPTDSIYGCCHEYATTSTQLEYDIDDFALSVFAGERGDSATAAKFRNRAQDWENIFNTSSGYIQPRHSNGRWMDGFDATLITSTSSNDFAEGDALTYTPDIPFNLAELATLEGGDSAMVSYLNSVLGGYQGLGSVIGTQANLGNEPGLEIPWEYDWVGEPYKTQADVRAIEDQLWSDTPGGIPGNDDLGEMSAWYVWSALGLYPEIPGTADLAIGSPLFPAAVVSAGGKTLTIDAPAAADGTPYVQGLTVNGTASSLAYLPAADVTSGATLDFTLGSSADSSWAAATADAPPSYNGTPGTGTTEPVGPITETGTGKCIDDAGAGTSNGTKIQIYTCNGTNAQTWTVAPDNTLQVLTDCMDVTNAGTTSGTLVQLHTCNGTGAQQWEAQSSGELVNPESGLCLTDPSAGSANSTQLEIAACTGTTKPSSVVGDSTNSFCIDPNHIAPLSQYYTDLKNNALPSFAFIEAGYGNSDEHPGSGQSILIGQAEVADVINAFMTSPEWSSSVFFLSYDEGGGPYDHVPPVPGHSNQNTDASLGTIPDIKLIAVNPDSYKPCVPSGGKPTTHCDLTSSDPGAKSTDAPAVDGFAAQLGFRLPNMVISPFTKKHYVSHIPMDHTAVIKFVENRFISSSAHLTNHDNAQPNLLDFFDFTDIPWKTPPTPPTPVSSTSLGYNPCTPASMGGS